MKCRELKVGDRLEADDGKIETICHIGNGMCRGHICLDYKSGRWSEVHPEDDVELYESAPCWSGELGSSKNEVAS